MTRSKTPSPIMLGAEPRCEKCGETITKGQRAVIATVGTVDQVGGLGIYKDVFTLREQDETIRHLNPEDCR